MDMRREVLDRLYRNDMLLKEAQQARLFRAAYREPVHNPLGQVQAYFSRWLKRLGTPIEAQDDCYNLRASGQPC